MGAQSVDGALLQVVGRGRGEDEDEDGLRRWLLAGSTPRPGRWAVVVKLAAMGVRERGDGGMEMETETGMEMGMQTGTAMVMEAGLRCGSTWHY